MKKKISKDPELIERIGIKLTSKEWDIRREEKRINSSIKCICKNCGSDTFNVFLSDAWLDYNDLFTTVKKCSKCSVLAYSSNLKPNPLDFKTQEKYGRKMKK
jgi:hypothetical protein